MNKFVKKVYSLNRELRDLMESGAPNDVALAFIELAAAATRQAIHAVKVLDPEPVSVSPCQHCGGSGRVVVDAIKDTPAEKKVKAA